MKAKTLTVLVIVVLALAAAYAGFGAYRISSSDAAADQAWEAVEAAYAARHRFMAELEAALGSAMPEADASYVEELAAARARYASAETPDARALAAGDVEAAYTALLLAVENHPSVRALRPVQALVASIAGTEADASAARTAYNAAVREYNKRSGRLPGYEPRSYFQSADGI